MEFEDWEKERLKLNNEVIVPAYRKFCKESGLNFHFWDELPEEMFNPEVALEEWKLHIEAMSCFNNLKQKYVLFNNKIYTYYFTNWFGEPDFDSWEIEYFLNHTHELENKVDGLQKQIYSAIGIIETISTLLLTILIGFLFSIFKAPEYILILGIILPIFILPPILLIVLDPILKKKFLGNPLKDYENEIREYKIRLESLKQQFKLSGNNQRKWNKFLQQVKKEDKIKRRRLLKIYSRPTIQSLLNDYNITFDDFENLFKDLKAILPDKTWDIITSQVEIKKLIELRKKDATPYEIIKHYRNVKI